ncbi:MAG: hypothetical protein KDD51_12550 [Bdellovibrionales bacterium]|nr:hypothetical protein [Bdellovibrionales bacterium]
MKIVVSLLALWLSAPLWGAGIAQPDIQFQYISLADARQFSCVHHKSEIGLYEWDVECGVDGKAHTYFVHLVLNFYPKTIHGENAYELLYWVTDMTDPHHPKNDSSTIWIHNGHEQNFMKVLEASQGIEDDLAYLKLTLKLKAPIAVRGHSMP